MLHTHTKQRIDSLDAVEQRYLPDALDRLNRFLRDHYSGEVGRIVPQVFDCCSACRTRWAPDQGCYEIVSGCRCPSTNAHLRGTRRRGVAKQRLHMQGRAFDVCLPGAPLDELRDAALSLRAGGVSYYACLQFVPMGKRPRAQLVS